MVVAGAVLALVPVPVLAAGALLAAGVLDAVGRVSAAALSPRSTWS